jgi:hypothetical protein
MKTRAKRTAPKIDAELQRAIARFPIRWTEPTIACAEAAVATHNYPAAARDRWVAWLDRIEDALLKVRRQAPECRSAVAR